MNKFEIKGKLAIFGKRIRDFRFPSDEGIEALILDEIRNKLVQEIEELLHIEVVCSEDQLLMARCLHELLVVPLHLRSVAANTNGEEAVVAVARSGQDEGGVAGNGGSGMVMGGEDVAGAPANLSA